MSATRNTDLRIAGRWMVSFLGFPLGGFTALLIVGGVDNLVDALIGGLITGAILGAVQSWGLGRSGPPARTWIAATAVGVMLGFGIGSAVVGYRTDLSSLIVQGAITGLVVGGAQALVLWQRLGRLVLVWPPVLVVSWALGWLVTTVAGIAVDQQFIVFGSSGALVVTALTVVLPLTLRRNAVPA
jgi:hypothetical protein